MGHVLPESLYEAGARAVFLNHAERPLTLNGLAKAIKRATELEMITIVCADSISEAKAITMLNPDIVLCEPSELIGTGKQVRRVMLKKQSKLSRALIRMCSLCKQPESVRQMMSIEPFCCKLMELDVPVV